MIRRLMIALAVAALCVPSLAGCGKKAPLDPPTQKPEKHKPAE